MGEVILKGGREGEDMKNREVVVVEGKEGREGEGRK